MNWPAWFAKIIIRIRSWFDLQARRKSFARTAEAILADGVLSTEKLRVLQEHQIALALTREQLGWVANRLIKLVSAPLLKAQRCSPEQAHSLEIIVDVFGASRAFADLQRSRLARARTLYDIEHGTLPVVSVDGMVLQSGERAHWAEFGSILEDRVVSRRYEGGSSGFSFRIMKGVTYRVGAHRGRLIAERGLVPVSGGVLVLTNKRVIFQGDRKSIAVKWEKLIGFQLFNDGALISAEGHSRPTMIKFQSTNQLDTLQAIVTHFASGTSV